MKITSVLGSQRKHSISTGILKYVSDKTELKKDLTLNLGSLKGCTGCQKCKERKEICLLSDEMKAYFKTLKEPSILLMASPNYMGDISGQFKQFMDRHYSLSFVDDLKVKKCYIFIAQGHGDLSYYKETYQRVKRIFESQLKAPVTYLVQSKKDWHLDNDFIKSLDDIVKEIENEGL